MTRHLGEWEETKDTHECFHQHLLSTDNKTRDGHTVKNVTEAYVKKTSQRQLGGGEYDKKETKQNIIIFGGKRITM